MKRVVFILFLVTLIFSCDLFNASLDPDYWQKIDDEIVYANAPWVPLFIETGGMGIADPTGPRDDLAKLAPSSGTSFMKYEFSLYFQPSRDYPFIGWQAWIDGEAPLAWWELEEWEKNEDNYIGFGANRVKFVPKNDDGTVVDIFVYEMPPENKRLYIGPIGADNTDGLNVSANAGGLGIAFPSGRLPGIMQGYPFNVSFQPDTAYEFRGWQAIFNEQGTDNSEQTLVSRWEVGSGIETDSGVAWSPRNASGTEMTVIIQDFPEEFSSDCQITIMPIGGDSPQLSGVRVESGGLGITSPTGNIVSPAVRQSFPFNVSFQASADFEFRGWQVLFDSLEPPSKWKFGEENEADEYIQWQPRNASGSEMSITIENLPENFLPTDQITIMPLDGNSNSINVVVSVPGSWWGTSAGTSPSRRQGFSFAISFNPSGNYEFRGWETVHQGAVISEWKPGVGVTGTGILWFPRNASGTEMDVIITAFDIENLTIRPIGSNNSVLDVSVESGNLGTVSSTVSPAVPAVQGFPFNVSFQPDAAYPFQGWQAVFSGQGTDTITRWTTGIPITTPSDNVTWSPRNASGTEMSVTIQELPAGFSPTTGTITIMPIGGESGNVNAAVVVPDGWGTASPMGTLQNRRQGFPIAVEFTNSAAWAFVEWRAYSGYTDPSSPGTQITAAAEAAFTNIDGGKATVTINTDEQITLIPWCEPRPRVEQSNPPLINSGILYSRGQPVVIIFSETMDAETVRLGSGFIEITGFDTETNEPVTNMQQYFSAPVLSNNNRVTITPASGNLPPENTLITFTLGTNLRAVNGHGLASSIPFNYRVGTVTVRKTYNADDIWALHNPAPANVTEESFFYRGAPTIRDRRLQRDESDDYGVTLYFTVTRSTNEITEREPTHIKIAEVHYANIQGGETGTLRREETITVTTANNMESTANSAGSAYRQSNPTSNTDTIFYKAEYTWTGTQRPLEGITRLVILPSRAGEADADTWSGAVAEGRFVAVVFDNQAPGGNAVLANDAGAASVNNNVYNYSSDDDSKTITINADFSGIVDNFQTGGIIATAATRDRPWTMEGTSALQWQYRIANNTGITSEHFVDEWFNLSDNIKTLDLTTTDLTSSTTNRTLQFRYRDSLGNTGAWATVRTIRYYNSARGVMAVFYPSAESTEENFIYQGAPLERDRRLRAATTGTAVTSSNATVTLYYYLPPNTTLPTVNVAVAEINYANLQGSEINTLRHTTPRTFTRTIIDESTEGADALYRSISGAPEGSTFYRVAYPWSGTGNAATTGIIRLAIMPFGSTASVDTWQTAVEEGRFVTVVFDNQGPGGSFNTVVGGEAFRDGNILIFNTLQRDLTLESNFTGITDNSGVGIPFAAATHDKPWTMEDRSNLQWQYRIVNESNNAEQIISNVWFDLDENSITKALNVAPALTTSTAIRNIQIRFRDSLGIVSAWSGSVGRLIYNTAALTGITVWNATYNETANEIRLTWTRPTTNPPSVEVYVNDTLRGTVTGTTASFNITGIPRVSNSGFRQGQIIDNVNEYEIKLVAVYTNGRAETEPFKIWNIPGMVASTTLVSSVLNDYRVVEISTQKSLRDDEGNVIQIGLEDIVLGNTFARYILTSDIELEDWTPIGRGTGTSSTTAFNGRFFGNGHTITIKSFNFDDSTTAQRQGLGLFGNVNNAIIRDLRIVYDDVEIPENDVTTRFGGISAYSAGSTQVRNVIVEGNVSSENLSHAPASGTAPKHIGGILGEMALSGSGTSERTNSSIVNCISNLDMDFNFSGTQAVYFGGVAGSTGAALSGVAEVIAVVTATGNLNPTHEGTGVMYTGGILGYGQARGIHRDLEFSGSISPVKTSTGTVMIGGITGYSFGANGAANNCVYSNLRVSGQVTVPSSFTGTGAVYLGGLFGSNSYTNTSDSWVRGDIRSDKNGSGTLYCGGFTGVTSYSTMNNCRYEQGSVISDGQGTLYLGGGIGNIANDTTLTNSYSRATLVSGSRGGESVVYVGGFVGYLQSGNINGCYSTAEVRASGGGAVSAGGLIGHWTTAVTTASHFTVSECYATGNVSATTSSTSTAATTGSGSNIVSAIYLSAGGLIGYMGRTASNFGLSVYHSYALGDVTADRVVGSASNNTYAGGLIGFVRDYYSNHTGAANRQYHIRYNYARGAVNAKNVGTGNVYAGGLVGRVNVLANANSANPSTLQNNAALGSVSAMNNNIANPLASRVTGRIFGASNASNDKNYAQDTMFVGTAGYSNNPNSIFDEVSLPPVLGGVPVLNQIPVPVMDNTFELQRSDPVMMTGTPELVFSTPTMTSNPVLEQINPVMNGSPVLEQAAPLLIGDPELEQLTFPILMTGEPKLSRTAPEMKGTLVLSERTATPEIIGIPKLKSALDVFEDTPPVLTGSSPVMTFDLKMQTNVPVMSGSAKLTSGSLANAVIGDIEFPANATAFFTKSPASIGGNPVRGTVNTNTITGIDLSGLEKPSDTLQLSVILIDTAGITSVFRIEIKPSKTKDVNPAFDPDDDDDDVNPFLDYEIGDFTVTGPTMATNPTFTISGLDTGDAASTTMTVSSSPANLGGTPQWTGSSITGIDLSGLTLTTHYLRFTFALTGNDGSRAGYQVEVRPKINNPGVIGDYEITPTRTSAFILFNIDIDTGGLTGSLGNITRNPTGTPNTGGTPVWNAASSSITGLTSERLTGTGNSIAFDFVLTDTDNSNVVYRMTLRPLIANPTTVDDFELIYPRTASYVTTASAGYARFAIDVDAGGANVSLGTITRSTGSTLGGSPAWDAAQSQVRGLTSLGFITSGTTRYWIQFYLTLTNPADNSNAVYRIRMTQNTPSPIYLEDYDIEIERISDTARYTISGFEIEEGVTTTLGTITRMPNVTATGGAPVWNAATNSVTGLAATNLTNDETYIRFRLTLSRPGGASAAYDIEMRPKPGIDNPILSDDFKITMEEDSQVLRYFIGPFETGGLTPTVGSITRVPNNTATGGTPVWDAATKSITGLNNTNLATPTTHYIQFLLTLRNPDDNSTAVYTIRMTPRTGTSSPVNVDDFTITMTQNVTANYSISGIDTGGATLTMGTITRNPNVASTGGSPVWNVDSGTITGLSSFNLNSLANFIRLPVTLTNPDNNTTSLYQIEIAPNKDNPGSRADFNFAMPVTRSTYTISGLIPGDAATTMTTTRSSGTTIGGAPVWNPDTNTITGITSTGFTTTETWIQFNFTLIDPNDNNRSIYNVRMTPKVANPVSIDQFDVTMARATYNISGFETGDTTTSMTITRSPATAGGSPVWNPETNTINAVSLTGFTTDTSYIQFNLTLTDPADNTRSTYHVRMTPKEGVENPVNPDDFEFTTTQSTYSISGFDTGDYTTTMSTGRSSGSTMGGTPVWNPNTNTITGITFTGLTTTSTYIWFTFTLRDPDNNTTATYQIQMRPRIANPVEIGDFSVTTTRTGESAIYSINGITITDPSGTGIASAALTAGSGVGVWNGSDAITGINNISTLGTSSGTNTRTFQITTVNSAGSRSVNTITVTRRAAMSTTGNLDEIGNFTVTRTVGTTTPLYYITGLTPADRSGFGLTSTEMEVTAEGWTGAAVPTPLPVWDGTRIVGINASSLNATSNATSRYFNFDFTLEDGANNKAVYRVRLRGSGASTPPTIIATSTISSSSAVASDPTGLHGAIRTWVQFTSQSTEAATGSWLVEDMLDFDNADPPPAATGISSPATAWDTSVVSRGYPRLRSVGGQ